MTAAGRTADLLLIESREADAELARRVLERAGWRRIAVARDGEAALALVHGPLGERLGIPPRLVLLDAEVRGLDWAGVLERVRRDPLSRMVPVVVLTGSRNADDVALAYRLGANGVVYKAADFERYAEALTRLTTFWLHANVPPP